MFKTVRYLAVILTAAALIGLAACGGLVPASAPETGGELLSVNSQSPENSGKGKWTDGRTEIVLSKSFDGFDPGFLANAVVKFNSRNKEYKVVYGDYANTSLLEAAIVSGTGPDIFVGCGLPELDFADFAYVDLLPLLEADTECGRGVYEDKLLELLSAEGGVYWLPLSYDIITFTGPEELLEGGKTGITMDEAREAAAAMGEGCKVFPTWMGKTGMLNHIISFSTGKYVDYEAGTCDFVNPEFIALLGWVNELPDSIGAEEQADSLLECCMVMSVPLLNGPSQANTDDSYMGLMSCAGKGFDYVGFPHESGSGSVFDPGVILAISSASEKQDGAWEFIRFLLSEEIQSGPYQALPVNRRALEAQIAQGLAGELLSDPYYPHPVQIEQEEVDKFLRLLESTDYLAGQNNEVNGMIRAEAEAFFAGEKTAEEVAEIIQSRASVYLGEKK